MKTVNFVQTLFVAFAITLSSFANSNAQTSSTLLVSQLAQTQPITSSGATVISTYQEGMAIIQLDGKFGFINKQGVEIVSPRYEDVHAFQNHYAAVKANGQWTFINKQGKKIAPATYDWVGSFLSNGVAPVQRNGKWGFINEQGQEITNIIYDQVSNFDAEGKAIVKRNGQLFTVTENGTETPMVTAAQADAAAMDLRARF